ncbi:CRISPR-associated endoribonuclease Cas6 [Clostridium sp. Marseille-P3244]|uniref:CRISPR-associated endoribonuclease Cas6 n=1 Tax=Clostridium sp. Marseille-P3244 TaxID=1871020 RepID=UPI00092FF2D1|nr:CRISPR-associated endoribonuclease Cas6 [Clostridium sp. Marseille-P3244]
MDTFSIRLKVYMLRSVMANQIQAKSGALIDKGFMTDKSLMKFHETNKYKMYCYNNLWPLEKDKCYKKGKIYTLTIRTIDPNLAKYFSEICPNLYTDELKGLSADIRILPKHWIQTLYTTSPVIIKDAEKGYWRTHKSLPEFEDRLKTNLIKKWNAFQHDKIDEDFQLYTSLEFLNEGPIALEYKNIKLLGDKIRLQIADNKRAQEISYMALGTGICEMNSRGWGFVNYRWM